MARKTLAQLEAMMAEVGMNGSSSLNMRNEEQQTMQRTKGIPRLQKALRKRARLLLFMELAIPFNPATGEADDQFNGRRKYRPPFSATTTALMVKEIANSNETVKEVLMRRAGVTEWDTSDLETFTEEDWTVFNKYRVPRIFTVRGCTVKIPAISNTPFGKNYIVNVPRDDDGMLIYEPDRWMKINKLFRDLCQEEVNEYEQQLADGVFNHDDDQQTKYKQAIWDKQLISGERPFNYVYAMEIPLTNKLGFSDPTAIDALEKGEDVTPSLVIANYGGKLRTAVENYVNGTYEAFDTHFDFIELDMVCPMTGDANTKAGKAKIGLDTTYDKATYSISTLDSSSVVKLKSVIQEHVDENLKIENQIRKSIWMTPMTEEVENQILEALPSVLTLEDKRLTQNVIMNNQEVISLAFGSKGAELIEEIDGGVSDKAKGTVEDSTVAYDLNNLDSFEDLEDVDIADTAGVA